MRKTLREFCEENDRTDILQSFDCGKNAPLTPDSVSYGSQRKLWWRCEHGHEWSAAVCTRTGGSGCPVCSGRSVLAGENDLLTRRPDLAAQWDAERNAPLTPDKVSAGSARSVWWVCEHGHRWRARIRSRTAGTGCPYCTGRRVHEGRNDLASTRPDLAAQWDTEANGALTPLKLAPGSSRKVWWRCEKGHRWCAEVRSRVQGSGCPVCAGKRVVPKENDLASRFPQIAAQWHPVKNGALTPSDCTASSNRKVWWICPEGHEYRAAVGARTVSGSGCPYCTGRKVLKGFNDLATLEPRIAAQWHPTLNGELGPDEVTVGSHRKAWWLCAEGHVWKAEIDSRTGTKKCGCPVCAGKAPRKRYAKSAAMVR